MNILFPVLYLSQSVLQHVSSTNNLSESRSGTCYTTIMFRLPKRSYGLFDGVKIRQQLCQILLQLLQMLQSAKKHLGSLLFVETLAFRLLDSIRTCQKGIHVEERLYFEKHVIDLLVVDNVNHDDLLARPKNLFFIIRMGDNGALVEFSITTEMDEDRRKIRRKLARNSWSTVRRGTHPVQRTTNNIELIMAQANVDLQTIQHFLAHKGDLVDTIMYLSSLQ